MSIKCQFKTLQIDGSARYSCEASSVTINHPKTKISAFLGKHHEGKSNIDVEYIIFKNCYLDYFPRRIVQHFPNLKLLRMEKCRLKEIARRDFVGLRNLTYLWLQNNELSSLPSDLFEDMKELTYIGIRESNLKFIDSRIFKPLKNQLTVIDFSGNNKAQAVYNQETCQIDTFLEFIDENFEKPLHDYENFQWVLKQLWETRCFADFTIKADKKRIKVHKSILGSQSSVFSAMFSSKRVDDISTELTICHPCPNSVEEFVKYLYTRMIPDTKTAMEIFKISSKYDFKDLFLEMEDIIVCNIRCNNSHAIEVLALGNDYNSRDLMSAAFERIKTLNPDINFAHNLIFKPDDVEELIKAKRQRDRDIELINNKYNELEKLLNK